jgi:enoyl-CoA hydratase
VDEDRDAREEQPPLLVDRRSAALWLTLNRPERLNAVSLSMYRMLRDALKTAGNDDAVHAIVLTGAGRAFCAGADLKQPLGSKAGPGGADNGGLSEKQRWKYVRAAQRANRAVQRSALPVIAAVNGPAIGGGLELALSCDFVIVAADAKLRLPEVALGTFVGGGITQTLPARVGMTRARELLLLGEFFTGEQAAAMGLVNRALPADQVTAAAAALADRITALAPLPLFLLRRLLRRSHRLTRRQAMAAEARALALCMDTEDWKEGSLAFREKRPPRFTGK